MSPGEGKVVDRTGRAELARRHHPEVDHRVARPNLADEDVEKFIPPEQRFYAGGPNDVRGFERNELGPVIYVVSKGVVDTAAAHGVAIPSETERSFSAATRAASWTAPVTTFSAWT